MYKEGGKRGATRDVCKLINRLCVQHKDGVTKMVICYEIMFFFVILISRYFLVITGTFERREEARVVMHAYLHAYNNTLT